MEALCQCQLRYQVFLNGIFSRKVDLHRTQFNQIFIKKKKKRKTLEKLIKKRFVSWNPTPSNIWLKKCSNAFKRSKTSNSTRMKFLFFLNFSIEIIAKFFMQEFDWMEKIIPNMHRSLYISKNSKYANREKYISFER